MCKEIPLSKGFVAVVDDHTYERIGHLKWYAQPRRNSDRVYAIRKRRVDGRKVTVYMHRIITDAPSGMDVDHINGNTLDNRKSNLRVCTRSQNMQNSRPARNAVSRYKGVVWNRRDNRWHAAINLRGTRRHLGCFINEIDAALAYDAAALKHFGDFARLNLPSQQPE